MAYRRGRFVPDQLKHHVRYLWCDGELVNAALVRAGHSEYWTKYGRSATHEAAFTLAP